MRQPQCGASTPRPAAGGGVHNAGKVDGGGDLVTSLAESSNTAFAEIATRTGLANITETAQLLSGQAAEFPTYPGIVVGGDGDDPDSIARTGFGQQDVRATPFEMAVVAGRIATNGALPPAHFQAGVCSPDGVLHRDISETTPPNIELDGAVTRPVIAGMTAAVEDGHAGALGDLAFPVAAKTGTADNGHGQYDGWVVALAPADDPKVVVATRVYGSDGTSRSGAGDAAPIAAAVTVAALDAMREDIDPCRGIHEKQGN